MQHNFILNDAVLSMRGLSECNSQTEGRLEFDSYVIASKTNDIDFSNAWQQKSCKLK